MNLKAIIYLIFFFQSIICFGQFKHPEPTIVRPTVILPENDINDYSKTYHHSNPNYLEVPINTEELRSYCKRTIELLSKI